MTKSKLGKKKFVWLTYSYYSPSLKEVWTEFKHGKYLETGADAEARKKFCLLACSACFLIELRITSPGMAPFTMAWALPHWSLIKKMLDRLYLLEAFSQLRCA